MLNYCCSAEIVAAEVHLLMHNTNSCARTFNCFNYFISLIIFFSRPTEGLILFDLLIYSLYSNIKDQQTVTAKLNSFLVLAYLRRATYLMRLSGSASVSHCFMTLIIIFVVQLRILFYFSVDLSTEISYQGSSDYEC